MNDHSQDDKAKYFEDISKLAGSAFGMAGNMGKEFEKFFQEQFAKVAQKMQLVTREEFEAVKEIATSALQQNATLQEQVTQLEKKIKEHSHDE